MKTLRISLACSFALSVLLFLPACLTGKKKPEELLVPRLMLEVRGITYGALTVDTVTLPVSGTKIALAQDPLISEFDIVNVELVQVEMGMALLVQTTELGARALYRGTVTHNGQRIVLMVNGNPIGARLIDGPIQDGNFYTFVEVDDEELGELVLNLKESIAYLRSQK